MNSYNYTLLESALQEYLETEKSQYQIAREYGIPRSTLNDHIRRLYGYVDRDMARRARGLPSLKPPDKSELVLSTCSDMSDRTSETPQYPVPDMSGNGRKAIKRGWVPWVVAAVLALAGVILLIFYLWWRRQGGEAIKEPEGPQEPPEPSEEQIIEKWREAFEGY